MKNKKLKKKDMSVDDAAFIYSEVASSLRDSFLKKGFTTDQSFELTKISFGRLCKISSDDML